MNITVIGAGYVGLVAAACFAHLGHAVFCIDRDENKIASLQQNIVPIYESHLETMLQQNPVQFINSLSMLPEKPDIIMIAVGTGDVKNVAIEIGKYLTQYTVIVNKSTVPVGVTEELEALIQVQLEQRGLQIAFDIVSNPEFLREGNAIHDFLHPERIILGLHSEKAKSIMVQLYTSIISPDKIYLMNIKDAEMTKYATNAMLATRISFINEIAMLCDHLGVDIKNVRAGMGADSRIGDLFMDPGCGYGGSCFPKDVKALIHMAEEKGLQPFILRAVEQRNFEQKRILMQKILKFFGDDLSNLTFGVWGLSFKPGTDDMREASSLVLLENLLNRSARVLAFDPYAMPKAQKNLPEKWFTSKQLSLVSDPYDALDAVDALILVTEWDVFLSPDFAAMKKRMRQSVIFDGRNQYNPEQCRQADFVYHGIGRGIHHLD